MNILLSMKLISIKVDLTIDINLSFNLSCKFSFTSISIQFNLLLHLDARTMQFLNSTLQEEHWNTNVSIVQSINLRANISLFIRLALCIEIVELMCAWRNTARRSFYLRACNFVSCNVSFEQSMSICIFHYPKPSLRKCDFYNFYCKTFWRAITIAIRVT